MLENISIKENQIKFLFPIIRIEIDLYKDTLYLILSGEEGQAVFKRIPLLDKIEVEDLSISIDTKNYFLTAVQNNFMVFAKTADPTKNESQGLLIYDIESKALSHKFEAARFGGFNDASSLKVLKTGFENINQQDIDLRSFRLKREVNHELKEIKQPFLLDKFNSLYEPVMKFLERSFNKTVIAPVEIFEYNDIVIICVHFMNDDQYEKHLIIIDQNGKLIFDKSIYAGVAKRIADSFFVYHNLLIFVSDYKEFNILTIPN